MFARPGVEKGRNVPTPHRMKELKNDQAKMKEQAEKSKAWVQQGMAADAKK
jgi:glutathione S-transferase